MSDSMRGREDHVLNTPIVELSDDTKLETTWGVLANYRKEIAERDRKIADLILERNALATLRTEAEAARAEEREACAKICDSQVALHTDYMRRYPDEHEICEVRAQSAEHIAARIRARKAQPKPEPVAAEKV